MAINIEEYFKRQRDLFFPPKLARESTVHIFGCGTNGSFTAVTLAKLGIQKLILYDYDDIELHNIANQFFRTSDVGNSKVFSTMKLIKEFSPISTALIKDDKVTSDTELNFNDGDVIVLAFDSLPTRKIVYEKAIKSGKKLHLIDGRMGGELLRIYVLKNLERDKDYERSLNAKVAPIICSARSICYNGVIIAGIITSLVKKVLLDQEVPKEIDISLKNYDCKVIR